MKYLVWSIEHGAWWKPGGMGYTRDRDKAGRFTLPAAVEAVHSGDSTGDVPEEAIVPEGVE